MTNTLWPNGWVDKGPLEEICPVCGDPFSLVSDGENEAVACKRGQMYVAATPGITPEMRQTLFERGVKKHK